MNAGPEVADPDSSTTVFFIDHVAITSQQSFSSITSQQSSSSITSHLSFSMWDIERTRLRRNEPVPQAVRDEV